MLEGIAIGDLHFDKLKTLFPDNHVQRVVSEIRKPLRYALDKGIVNVFFLGDVCETSRLSYESLCGLIELISEFDGKLNMYWILGNHDFDEHGVHSLQPLVTMFKCGLFKTTHIFDKPTKKLIDGIKVNFSSYPSTQEYKDAVNVGHFEVSGSTRDNGTRITKGHAVKFHWLMGHLHTPHSVGNVHYAGTLYQLNFGESLPKGFIHFKYYMKNGKLKSNISRIKNEPKFKLVNKVIETSKDFKSIEKDPDILYKLFINVGVEVPPSLMEDFPNIVKHDGFSNKKELSALQKDAFIELENQEVEEVSEEEYIKAFLKNKGRDKTQIKRGLKLLSQIKGKGDDKKSPKSRIDDS